MGSLLLRALLVLLSPLPTPVVLRVTHGYCKTAGGTHRDVKGMSTMLRENSADAWRGVFLRGCSLPSCLLFIPPQREGLPT